VVVLASYAVGASATPNGGGQNANANTRIYNADRTVMITQMHQGEQPDVAWWGAQGEYLQAFGVYGNWTVSVEWPADEQQPDVDVIFTPPPPPVMKAAP
jgi:hypothetical protein